ncbi:paraquat-inducible protein A [Azomonas macrocytogenes]|uniref:Paraquat-inducible protein A n=1 Tax=Azomonas macrocytogenes TaxID=69962 RepID=A0A839T3N7_AZOMA|nr:paraquat-inducible protein A [Azomonas macrocytogenes]MBB3104147.1 paraquat-inducible protein A [Azomonas macrocytogenes]
MAELADSAKTGGLSLDQLIGCPECDLLMEKPTISVGEKVICPCCGYELYALHHQVVGRSLALVIAALLFYVPANFLPIMHLNLLGRVSHETVWSGVLSLYRSDMAGLALIVFLCSMAVPLLKLLCQLAVLLTIFTGYFKGYGLWWYRSYHHLKEWGMLEVYLLGILVSIVKLAGMADLGVGSGLICFIGLLVVQILLELIMSPEQIWQALSESS